VLSLDGGVVSLDSAGGVSLGAEVVVTGAEDEVVVVSAPELLDEVTLSDSEEGAGFDDAGAGGVDVSLEEVVETDVVSDEGALEEVTTTDSDWVDEVSADGVDEELVVTDSDWVVVVSTVWESVVVDSEVVATTTEVSWVAVSVEAELADWVSAVEVSVVPVSVEATVEVSVLVSAETVSWTIMLMSERPVTWSLIKRVKFAEAVPARLCALSWMVIVSWRALGVPENWPVEVLKVNPTGADWLIV
jgi:hypothetical protein